MKHLLWGLLLAVLVLRPHLAAPAIAGVWWVAVQPLSWAFAAGLLARPWLIRHLPRRLP